MKTQMNTLHEMKSTNYGEATIVGVFLVVVPILFSFFCYIEHVRYYGTEVYVSIMSFGAVFARLIATSWISTIAGDLNRNRMFWSLFAFFLPGLALIVIGQKSELKHRYTYKDFIYQSTMKLERLAPAQAMKLKTPFKAVNS